MTTPRGPRLVAVEVCDEPAAWAEAGFTTDERGAVMLGPLTIVPTGDTRSEPVLVFDRPHPAGIDDLDGLPWRTDGGPAADRAVDTTVHANGIDGFDHLVVMAPDLGRLRSALVGAGLEIRRERAARMAGSEIVQLFAWAGDVLLEVVAPAEPPEPGSPDRPAQVWGFAFVATDLDATTAWFGDRSSEPRAAVQAGRRISTLRHAAMGMTLTAAVMSARHRENTTNPSG